MANQWLRTVGFRIAGCLALLVEIITSGLFRLMHRRRGDSMPPIKDVLLLDSATSLARKIRERKISSVEVLKSFMRRIEEVNPLLNCVVDRRFEDALKEAEMADELIRNSDDLNRLAAQKPFLGVPFTTKDCIAVKGMMYTAGLYVRKDTKAKEDADSISALRNAGAIPIALTNVSELCMWWESHNRVHGRTSNPYDTNRIVGGSSGGEGCAQASCVSAFGLGSDIGGSIRMPAHFNGVFGHKPSKFIVSNKGQFPEPVSEEQNSFLGIGPLCRRAEDLLPLLKILAGPKSSQLNLDQSVDLKKVRFFYQDTSNEKFVTPVAKDIKQLFEKVANHLKQVHKIEAERTAIRKFNLSMQLWLCNMKTDKNPFKEQLTNLKGAINIPWEFLKWFVGCSRHTFIALCTALAEQLGPPFGSAKHKEFVERRDVFRREIQDMLGTDGVLLYPTHPTAALYHNEPVFKAFNFSYTAIVNVLTLPSTHVPLGLDSDGLPIGIQVIANDKCDRLCLAVAVELEKAFGGWTPPPIEV